MHKISLSIYLRSGLTILFLITLFLNSPAQGALAGARYYVNGNGGNDANTGASWSQAFKNLQKALSVVSSGDEIWVAKAVYYPDNGGSYPLDSRDATYFLLNGVQIYGGFAGTETSLSQRNITANPTILSGDVDNNDTNTDANFIAENTADIVGNNAYRVVTSIGNASTAVLDGFIITAGLANAATDPTRNGGGLYAYQSSPTLRNLRFIGSQADVYGGGMFNWNGNPTLTNVDFKNNFALTYGGGMGNVDGAPTLTNVIFDGNIAGNAGGGMLTLCSSATAPQLDTVTFSNNQAPEGGGLGNNSCNPQLVNVTFDTNYASTSGGGMANRYSGNTSLSNVTFQKNSSISGGGMFNFDSQPNLLMVDFLNNQAALGAGIYNDNSQPWIQMGTFYSNTATGVGGAMHNLNGSTAHIEQITFMNNQSESGAGMYNYLSNPTLVNVDFNRNHATSSTGGGGGMYNYSSSPTLQKVTFVSNSAANNAGGGMYNYNGSSPKLTDVTFSANFAINGGGMRNHYNNNQPELTNVTFVSNEAQYGAGMSNDNSTPRLYNVTFSANYANQGGGMLNYQSNPQIWNTTFYGNIAQAPAQGGGMYNVDNSLPFLRNVILAGSTNGDCVNGPGGNISGWYTLIQDSGALACGAINGVLGFVVGQDPKLGQLANNGGFTQTHAPAFDSPVIDQVSDNLCSTPKDQRGNGRFLDGNNDSLAICDIGAVEFGNQVYLAVILK